MEMTKWILSEVKKTDRVIGNQNIRWYWCPIDRCEAFVFSNYEGNTYKVSGFS